jgi:hypothetical protein
VKRSLEEEICLSREGKAFKTDLSWEEHESAAWTHTSGLHGWVDNNSPIYSASFRCPVKAGPGPLWTWKVEIKDPALGRYRARGYLIDPDDAMEFGKEHCFTAFCRLLIALQAQF